MIAAMTVRDWDISHALDTVRQMCKAAMVSVEEVRGSARYPRLVEMRRKIAKRLRDDGYSYPAIGRALGGKHHTSVMHMVRS